MPTRIVFVTPTHAADLERFQLQRLSIKECRIDIPQIAIVPPEDLQLFKGEIPEDNLTIISSTAALDSADLAPNPVATPRAELECAGWTLQQITKLAFPRFSPAKAAVCLDSDVFFLDRVTADDFYDKSGRLKLWEEEERFSEWFSASWHFLMLPGEPLRHYNYVFMLLPLHREVVMSLQNHISAQHGKHWAEAFAESSATEYMTYGVFAREINQFKHVAPFAQSLCFTFWPGMEGHILDFDRIVKKHNPKAISIQSSIGWPISSYGHFIEQHWDGSEEGPTR